MDLIIDISVNKLKEYIIKQLNNFFPDGKEVVDDFKFNSAFNEALERLEYCFRHITVRGYSVVDGGREYPFFQHTNSDQYCQFLYFLSNTLWNNYPENKDICDKIILLNKLLHGCWYTYRVKLPDIFLFIHPIGSIIGHAKYSNYLVICQNVTIGERRFAENEIGEYCFLSTGATIIGDERIGNKVSIGVNATVFREEIPDNSIVYQDVKSGKTIITKQKKEECKAKSYFK